MIRQKNINSRLKCERYKYYMHAERPSLGSMANFILVVLAYIVGSSLNIIASGSSLHRHTGEIFAIFVIHILAKIHNKLKGL